MNKQEIYNKVRTHLLTQMQKSEIPGVGCAYRGENGLMCAVGCLIPDELYEAEMENKSAMALMKHSTYHRLQSLLGIKYTEDENFIQELQTIHDQKDIDNWEEALNKFAIKHNLEIQT